MHDTAEDFYIPVVQRKWTNKILKTDIKILKVKGQDWRRKIGNHQKNFALKQSAEWYWHFNCNIFHFLTDVYPIKCPRARPGSVAEWWFVCMSGKLKS